MYRRYKDQADFKMIYVREAHPDDGWQTESNRRAGIVYKTPTNDLARAAIAADCVRALGITFPCLVDDMQDSVQKLLRAWPARAGIVGADGRIAYLSAPGPRGVDPDAIEAALKRTLAGP
ncbi:MAG: deiodinase [Lentisphaerae bacterium]|nr:deiodinase [Lentisphaerota bacterium]